MKINFPANKQAELMVETQLKSRDIYEEKVLEVMKVMPRHLFVSGKSLEIAYGDYPLSIGHEQTISQPYIVAYMTQALQLKGTEKILEIGTGSGYQTAILAELGREVYTIDIIEVFTKKAKRLLEALGYQNISFKTGDGNEGWSEVAPFERILVTAAAAKIPEKLLAQLSDNGIMVLPLGESKDYQEIEIIRKLGKNIQRERTIGCRFVPLVGS